MNVQQLTHDDRQKLRASDLLKQLNVEIIYGRQGTSAYATAKREFGFKGSRENVAQQLKDFIGYAGIENIYIKTR